MNVASALTWAQDNLKKSSTSPQLDAEVLLAFSLGQDKELLFKLPEQIITDAVLKKFQDLVNRRSKGEPVAYLTGQKEFYSLNFYVDRRVLIPRPATEILVAEALARTKTGQTVVDVGTGSGCIAITLAKHLPKNQILAIDTSEEALEVAKKNAADHGVAVQFFHGDLIMPVAEQNIDIVVANLPYLDFSDFNSKSGVSYSPELAFEPPTALNGGHFGIEIYTKLLAQLSTRSQLPNMLLLEMDPEQIKHITVAADNLLPIAGFDIKKDLAGLDRILVINLAV